MRTLTRLNEAGVIDVEVSNRLLDPDQPDLLADDSASSTCFAKITFASSQVLVVTRFLPPSMRSNVTSTLSDFRRISRFHADPCLRTSIS